MKVSVIICTHNPSYEYFTRVVDSLENQTINKDSWELFRNVIETNKKTLIKITKGEEDLLVLPLIDEIPIVEKEAHFAFYGQPPITDSEFVIPEGIVIVNVDKDIKEKVRNVISKMEKF